MQRGREENKLEVRMREKKTGREENGEETEMEN